MTNTGSHDSPSRGPSGADENLPRDIESLTRRERFSSRGRVDSQLESDVSDAVRVVEDARSETLRKVGIGVAAGAVGLLAVSALSKIMGRGKEASEAQDGQRRSTLRRILRRILTFIFGAGVVGGTGAAAVSRLRSGAEEAAEAAEDAVSEGRDLAEDALEGLPEEQRLRAGFEAAKENTTEYVSGWGEVASMVGLGTETLTRLRDRIASLEYEEFLSDFGDRAKEILKDPMNHIDEIRRWIMEKCRGISVADEYLESRMESPTQKAESITRRGMDKLRRHLEEKGVSGSILTEFDRLSGGIVSPDYTRVSDDLWGELSNLLNRADVGLDLKNKGGRMVIYDYANLRDMAVLPSSYIVGFSPAKDGQEILDMPTIYFGRHSVLEVSRGLKDHTSAFIDAIRDGVGGEAQHTLKVLEKMEFRGTDWIQPGTYKEIIEALQKDAREGNVVYGIAKSGALILWNNGWVLIRNSWSTMFSSLTTLASTSWREDIPTGLEAAAIEYAEGAGPMAVIYGLPATLLAFSSARKGALIRALVNVVAMPGAVVWKTGEMAARGVGGVYRGMRVGKDLVTTFDNRHHLADYYYRHYRNQNYIRKFVPERMRLRLMGSTWSHSRLLEIQDKARRVASLEHYDAILTRDMGRDLHRVGSLGGSVDAARLDLQRTVEQYISKNFKHTRGGLLGRVPAEISRGASDAVVKEYAERFMRGDAIIRLESVDLQRILDGEIIRLGAGRAGGLIRQVAEFDQLEARRHDFYLEARKRTPNTARLERLHGEITSMERRAIAQQHRGLRGSIESISDLVERPMTETNVDRRLDMFRNAINGSVETERRVDQLVRDRIARIERLGMETPAAERLARETDNLVEGILRSKNEQLELLGSEYKKYRRLLRGRGVRGSIRDLTGRNRQLREFDNLWRQAVRGHGGERGLTRVMRNSKGRVKFAGLLLIPTMYMQYRDIQKEAAENGEEAELLQIISELGPSAIQLVADVASPFGATDWYTVWTGKEAITGKEVDTRHRVSRFIWGTFAAASDTVTALTIATGAGAPVGAGVGTASRVVRMSRMLARAGASKRVIAKAPRIVELLRSLGPGKFAELLRTGGRKASGLSSARAAISAGRKAGQGSIRTGIRLTEIAAGRAMCADLAITVGGAAYQAVFGHDDDHLGVEEPPASI